MDLERNLSSNERSLRLLGGVFIATIGIATLGFGSFFGFIFTLAGLALTATAVVSFCPVYQKLGMNSFRT